MEVLQAAAGLVKTLWKSFPNRENVENFSSVKEDDLLDAVEARVREILQVNKNCLKIF